MFDELKNSCRSGAFGGFLPGVKQIANVAALPGIVGVSNCCPQAVMPPGFQKWGQGSHVSLKSKAHISQTICSIFIGYDPLPM